MGRTTVPGEDTYDFFIAHASADKQAAEMLYGFLSAECRVFLDTRSIRPGDDWDVALVQAQRSSRITVVLVSANSGTAYYQREEIAAAIAMTRRDSHRVVPIFLHPTSPSSEEIPYGLRLKHGLSARGKHGLYLAARSLVEHFKRPVDGATRHGSPGLTIGKATVLWGRSGKDVGFEILVANKGQTHATITDVSIGCRFLKEEPHFAPLPCHTCVVRLDLDDATASDGRSVGGVATEHEDPWGRPVDGILSVAGQAANLELSFPMYRTLEAGEQGLIRFVFKSPVTSPGRGRPAGESRRFEGFAALLESAPVFGRGYDGMPGGTWIVLEGDWGQPSGVVLRDHSLLELLGVLEGWGPATSVKVRRQ